MTLTWDDKSMGKAMRIKAKQSYATENMGTSRETVQGGR